MNKSTSRQILAILSIAVVAVFFILTQSEVEHDEPLIGRLSIAASKTVSPALIWVAQDKGFFRKVGLDVTVKPYSSGKTTTEAMLRKEIDLSASAEFLAARKSYNHKELRIFGTLAFVHQIKLLGLRTQGIESLTDIKGKRIAVKLGTNGEYFLKRLLTLNGIQLDELQLINMKPQEMKRALVQGAVDAAFIWPPLVQQIKEHFGDTMVVFDGQPGQDYYYLLLGRKEWAEAHPDIAEQVMRALVMAEKWLQQNPQEAAVHLGEKYNVATDKMLKILEEYRFSVSFPQSLVIAMESQYQWLEQEELVTMQQRPKLLDLLVTEPLGRVDSTRVNIPH
ncbi:MAG: ABC transporter substrate-binding protein [Candidatus Thiodiazotropha sp. (ex. Lucinisca nassula)]|nr:ABC transporter substrate-binding protein [Candidatus Thiodiazotropha sp. (ex. Lucinisca nassula)]